METAKLEHGVYYTLLRGVARIPRMGVLKLLQKHGV